VVCTLTLPACLVPAAAASISQMRKTGLKEMLCESGRTRASKSLGVSAVHTGHLPARKYPQRRPLLPLPRSGEARSELSELGGISGDTLFKFLLP
jgi:hypothetical protein